MSIETLNLGCISHLRDGSTRYFDKNGCELFEGDKVRLDDGSVMTLLKTTDGELGTDATNPAWVEIGKAIPGEYGVYPLSSDDVKMVGKVNVKPSEEKEVKK